MEPRGFWTIFWITVLVPLVCIIVYAAVSGKFEGDLGEVFLKGRMPRLVILFIVFGLYFAYKYRGLKISLPFKDRQEFIVAFDYAIRSVGFELKSDLSGWRIYWNPILSILYGRIGVQVRDSKAVVVGPKHFVKKLLRLIKQPM